MPYPPKKTPELCEQVLSRIAQGETLAAIARDLDFTPMSWATWMRSDEALAIAYAGARDVGADVIAEQAFAIIEEEPARIEGKIDPGHVQWQRARVETRLKLLAKWQPKKYGDKQTTELTGADGKAVQVETALTPEQVASLTAAILSKPEGA